METQNLPRIKPYEGDEAYIFVSYSHRDSYRVFPILKELSERGYRIWYDEGIDPGTEWPESIARHLAGAKVCLAFISAASIASNNCRREINFALSRDKGFLSVMLEDAEMSPGMEMQISTYQSLMSFKYPNQEAFIEKLCSADALRPCRHIPQAPAPAPVQTPAPAPAPVQTSAPTQPAVQAAPVQPAPQTFQPASPETVSPQKAAQQKVAQQPVQQAPRQQVPQTAQPAAGKVAPKKKGKVVKTILIVIGVIILAAILGIVLIVTKPFKKRVKIDGTTYENNTIVTIKETSLSAEEIRSLKKLDQLVSFYFKDCSFESGTEEAISEVLHSTKKGLYEVSFINCEGLTSLQFLDGLEMTTLTVSQASITDAMLDSIELAAKIREIDLSGNSLTKIPVLPDGTNLKKLKIENNQISDISELSKTPNLTELHANGNQIMDISVLEPMIYLEVLELGDNQVKDLSPMAHITQLKTLVLYGSSSIADISLVLQNPMLTKLDLSGIAIADASGLSDLTKMKELYLNECGLTDIAFVSGMTELTRLSLAGNQITRIKALEPCTKLTFINLSHNKIESLEGFPEEGSVSGRSVFLHDNQLRSLTGMKEGQNYRVLTLYQNPWEDGSLIGSLKGTYLILEYSPAFTAEGLDPFVYVYATFSIDDQLELETVLMSSLKKMSMEEALETVLKQANLEGQVY